MEIDNKWFRGCVTSQEDTELLAALAEMGIPSTVIKHLDLCTSKLSGKYLSEPRQCNKANTST